MTDDPNLQRKRVRFETLALPHLDAAFNLARWLARNDQDACDVVQEAFLRAFEALDGLRGDNARPWLLAIVRNTCFTWLARNRPGCLQVPYDDETDLPDDIDGDPERLAQRAEDCQRIDAAISRLPMAFREVVVLRELEDLSYREIASALAIPVGTVMSRLARARQLLAKDLTDATDGA
jgi:RNA polymerase sigma-70 factor (ECF subfamily)